MYRLTTCSHQIYLYRSFCTHSPFFHSFIHFPFLFLVGVKVSSIFSFQLQISKCSHKLSSKVWVSEQALSWTSFGEQVCGQTTNGSREIWRHEITHVTHSSIWWNFMSLPPARQRLDGAWVGVGDGKVWSTYRWPGHSKSSSTKLFDWGNVEVMFFCELF